MAIFVGKKYRIVKNRSTCFGLQLWTDVNGRIPLILQILN